jgi:multicomponent Na+:H+ antiporter subunit B
MIKDAYASSIVRTIVAFMVPFVQLFALYVVIHGHYGPGGGFQGGVLLATSIIMQRICDGRGESFGIMSPIMAIVFAVSGMLIFIITGLIPLFYGGAFLDYSSLPLFWVHGAELRSLGILIAEIGIALAVFGTMVAIFDTLAGEEWGE